ncbi:DUF1566 domain-containing protein [Paraburkholderia tagetis]|uniref:DUF1566 domain-containing protein n=1 Tax=Paraburkholderia tagetis TaxID=2913261 RepID=A0A9X1RNY7_9BURK|nr:DUF1566 domain-containing protein [Paraburkholderia tagetis]MCG5072244.1 DUF1566 domain-containing protein [Paraburkholderia tagetis]
MENQISETVSINFPKLDEGEHYAGVLLGKDGAPNHHVILLPGDIDDGTWHNAKEWAASIGGELPTRREQSLLFANLGEQFEEDWYWSIEEYSDAFAWCQLFGNGNQLISHKVLNLCRARAVRRLPI